MRPMNFLITIFNQSDEWKEQQKEPNFEERRLFAIRKENTKPNQRLKEWKEEICK